jgi:hypothetical protein
MSESGSERARRLVQESIADDDAKAANKIKKDLYKVVDVIEDAMVKIEKELSDFNSPGLKAAFLKGLKSANDGRYFRAGNMLRELDNYYKAHK